MPARDYMFQDTDYNGQIKQATNIIEESDYILIGAGAGMSTAAGAKYGGEWFEENFAEFQKKYAFLKLEWDLIHLQSFDSHLKNL